MGGFYAHWSALSGPLVEDEVPAGRRKCEFLDVSLGSFNGCYCLAPKYTTRFDSENVRALAGFTGGALRRKKRDSDDRSWAQMFFPDRSDRAVSVRNVCATPGRAQLTLSQVVESLVQKNAERAEALENYRGKRIYKLDYKGFPSAIRAEMIVEMTYEAPAKKDFKILSESGSKWIVKRVLQRLIAAETEAQEAANRGSVELNAQNYEFTSLEHRPSADGCD